MTKPSYTKLNKIEINKFRGLNSITIDIAKRITLICGKNGTSKSSILGIAAQVFSFEKDYTKDKPLSFNRLTGEPFKSKVSEHFRLSKTFDTTGSMDTTIHIDDGYTGSPVEFSLKLYNSADRKQPRPVVRGNETSDGSNTSRNATHPVIYLSLKRLTPISLRPKYTSQDLDYLKENEQLFLNSIQKILGKFSTTKITATQGTIGSVVAHGDNYDQDSVSAGEDNVGQIVMAVFSFKKLSEEYDDYKGGLLLIDEADAGLFPAAQIELLKFLNKECKSLNLQVIMTSHSPTMIEHIYETNKSSYSDNKTVYLTDSYGAIATKTNFSWPEIYADLHQKTVAYDGSTSLPEVNVYFEDKECADLFSAIITSRPINKAIKKHKDIALGCAEYIKLIKRNIPEFKKKSIIVLDGDVESVEKLNSIIKLPSKLPPDQLIFEFLFNMPADDSYWHNKSMYTKGVFLKSAQEITNALGIPAGTTIIDLIALAKDYSDNKNSKQPALRTLFKNFSHDQYFRAMVDGPVKYNPYRVWVSRNTSAADIFNEKFRDLLKKTLTRGFGVDPGKLSVLD